MNLFSQMFRPTRQLTIVFSILVLSRIPLQAQSCDNLSWDPALVRSWNGIGGTSLITTSKVVSDALLPVVIGVPVTLSVLGHIDGIGTQAERRKLSETGLQSFVTMGITYGSVVVLKHLINRDRPFQAYPDCITNYRSDSDGSFPSGHSAGSAALATTLSLRYPTWYVIGPSVAYALYTGFSRIHLGMHHLTDVVAGYALGSGVAVVVHLLSDELFDMADPLLPSDTQPGAMIVPQTNVFSISIPF